MSSKGKREVVNDWEARGRSDGLVLRLVLWRRLWESSAWNMVEDLPSLFIEGVAAQVRDREEDEEERSEGKEAVPPPNGEHYGDLSKDAIERRSSP